MIRTIKGQLLLSVPRFIFSFFTVLGCGLFGTLLFEFVMRLSEVHSEEPTTFEMALLIAFIAYCALIFFYGLKCSEQEFNYAIGMGRTRTGFLIGQYLVSLLASVCGIAALGIVYLTEQYRLHTWWKQYPCETDFAAALTPALICFFVILLTVTEEFFGFLTIRFGKKAFWAVWSLWMIGCIMIPRTVDDIEEGKNSILGKFGYLMIDIFKGFSPLIWCFIFSVIGIVLILITYLGYKRQRVTF